MTEIQELRIKVDNLATLLMQVVAHQKTEIEKVTKLVMEESEKNAQRFQTMESRLGVAKAPTKRKLEVLTTPASNISAKRKREFTPLQTSYTDTFKRLNIKNLLQPIGPTDDPPASDRPAWWDANTYCLYHRGKGHDTEKCFRLKHKIENMISTGELPKPTQDSKSLN